VCVLPDHPYHSAWRQSGYGRAGQPHPRSGARRQPEPGRWMSPGWRPSPRSPAVWAPGRQPGRPGARPRASAASRHPGRRSCPPLHRDPLPASTSKWRAPCGAHDGRGCQRRGNPGGHCRQHHAGDQRSDHCPSAA